jgi:hypothetical protein
LQNVLIAVFLPQVELGTGLKQQLTASLHARQSKSQMLSHVLHRAFETSYDELLKKNAQYAKQRYEHVTHRSE